MKAGTYYAPQRTEVVFVQDADKKPWKFPMKRRYDWSTRTLGGEFMWEEDTASETENGANPPDPDLPDLDEGQLEATRAVARADAATKERCQKPSSQTAPPTMRGESR